MPNRHAHEIPEVSNEYHEELQRLLRRRKATQALVCVGCATKL